MTEPLAEPTSNLFRICLIATGGTIEKRYDARRGVLTLDTPVIEQLLETLAYPGVAIEVERLMMRDSLHIDARERRRIIEAVAGCLEKGQADAIIVTHGTDTLAETARALHKALDCPRRPVLITGAMVPWCAADSDAAQNVAQALMASRLLDPGIYAVCHGHAIRGDRVVKDYDRLTLAERKPGTF